MKFSMISRYIDTRNPRKIGMEKKRKGSRTFRETCVMTGQLATTLHRSCTHWAENEQKSQNKNQRINLEVANNVSNPRWKLIEFVRYRQIKKKPRCIGELLYVNTHQISPQNYLQLCKTRSKESKKLEEWQDNWFEHAGHCFLMWRNMDSWMW